MAELTQKSAQKSGAVFGLGAPGGRGERGR